MRWVIVWVSLVAASGCTRQSPFEPSSDRPAGLSVTYDGNGNTDGAAPIDSGTYAPGQTVTVLANSGSLVKNGNSFVAWNSQADGGGTAYLPGQTFSMGTADVTLYAKWALSTEGTPLTYTATYDGNGNTDGTAPTDSARYAPGQTVTVFGDSGSLVKSGNRFVAWNTRADGSGTTYLPGQSFNMGTADVTLFAQWAPLTYTVTYDGNGNTDGTPPTDSVSYTQGQTATVLGKPASLLKSGSTFIGWNTKADGSGATLTQGQTFNIGSDVTLYANWTTLPSYAVTYDGNGNTSGVAPTDTTNYLQGHVVTTMANSGGLANAGYVFAGWTTNATTTGSSATHTAGAAWAMGSSDVILYAVWIPSILTFSSPPASSTIALTGYGTAPTGALSVPPGVTAIGAYAFRGCSGLTSVTLPTSVTSIGTGAFWGSSGLSSIAISASVTSIASYAFYGCSGLTSVTIPTSITSIADSAFQGCTGLGSVTIPASVTSIGSSAFKGCTGLTSVTIPASVTSIGSNAFQGCIGLTSVTIPASVTSIGSSAFDGCTGLTSVAIPASVTSIGTGAFTGCTGLTSVTIPASVTSIGTGAFTGCGSLAGISVDPANLNYSSSQGVLFNKAQTTLIAAPGGMTGAYNGIPATTTSVGAYAFRGCSGLTSVTLPASVTSLGTGAFMGCSGLSSIGIFASLTSMPDFAFQGCSGLTSVTLPMGMTSIGNYAFQGCSGLTGIAIPAGVTSIGNYAFQGCSGLSSVTLPVALASIGTSAFQDCTGLTSVTVPASVTSIGDSAFQNCTGLATLSLSSGLISIGSNAFFGSGWLTNVTIPASVTSIGGYAFFACPKLTGVSIPASVTSIGTAAFGSCRALTNISVDAANPAYSSAAGVLFNKDQTILLTVPAGMTGAYSGMPATVTSIADSAFRGCSGLTGVTLPMGVTSIGDYAFESCTGLTGVTLPASVISIGSGAFQNCTGLTGITLPASVTSIGSYAFFLCSALTGITLPASVTSIGSYAFFLCSALTSVALLASTPPGLPASSQAFGLVGSGFQIHVPNSADVASYQAATGWSAYASVIVYP